MLLKNVQVGDLVAEIKDSGLYSISADEKADRSNTEQLTICLRFVDKNLNIIELNMKKIIYSFARKHPRRMMLNDIINDSLLNQCLVEQFY